MPNTDEGKKVYTDRPDLEDQIQKITIETSKGKSMVSLGSILSRIESPKARKEILFVLCLVSNINPLRI